MLALVHGKENGAVSTLVIQSQELGKSLIMRATMDLKDKENVKINQIQLMKQE
jgi:hypothetical protein